jgi:hypothetical protein
MSLSASDAALLWRSGRLRYKLHAGQREGYDAYRSWEKSSLEARKRGEILLGLYPRVFVFDCARRFGKDFLGLLIRIEDALQRPGSIVTYATAFGKDITDIVIPLVEKITEDCPASLKPYYKASSQDSPAGFYFKNKSIIKLVGIDKNPEGLRGRHSDGITISEAGFIDNLKHAVVSVLLPQLQGRLHATIFFNSTPPVIPGHAYDDIFVPDAIDRGAYIRRTIEDNPMLSDAERQEFILAAGGRGAEVCEREYFVQRIRSETRVVVPEFSVERHVIASPEPEYALGFTSIDPGISDICAVLCGYYDFDRAKLVIRRDWGKAGAATNVVVDNLRKIEAQTFGNLWYWNSSKFVENPFLRVSDTDSRLITDLNAIHGLRIAAADKTAAEAALHQVRNGFQQDRIEIHPDCKLTIDHLQNGVWNKSRTSYERSDVFGHFDAIDSLKYMLRHVNKTTNPNPPKGVKLREKVSADDIFSRPEHFRSQSRLLEGLQDMLPKGWKVKR